MNWRHLAIPAALTAYLGGSAFAADPESPVRMEMKIISMPQEDALSIISTGEIALSETTLSKIDSLRKSGTARLEVHVMAYKAPGESAEPSKTAEEIRHPIEWSPGDPSRTLSGIPMPPEPMRTRVVPRAFDIADVGFQFCARPTAFLENAISVDLEFTTSKVRHWKRAAAFRLESGLAISHAIPEFDKQSIHATFTVQNGRWTLIGSVKEADDSPRIQLRLFRAKIPSETSK